MLVEQLADALGRDGEPVVLGCGAHDAVVVLDYGVVLVCHGVANEEPLVARQRQIREGGEVPGAAENEKARDGALAG